MKAFPKKVLTLSVLLFASVFLSAQSGGISDDGFGEGIVDNSLNPSPESQELIKYVTSSPDLTTGNVSTSIPIHTISVDRMQVPVSLNYASGGVKVDDVSTEVGLNWSLGAGGKVTRVVRDEADELSAFYDVMDQIPYSDYQNSSDHNAGLKAILEGFAGAGADSEPDMFYYNIPGHSGGFILQSGGAVKKMVFSHVDIFWEIIPGTTSPYFVFTITTPDGLVYKLGENAMNDLSERRSFSQSPNLSYLNSNSCQQKDFDIPVPTSWHLTRIYDGNGDASRDITFTYESAVLTYEESYSESVAMEEYVKRDGPDYISGIGNNGGGEYNCPRRQNYINSGCISRVTHQIKRIREIIGNKEKVSFSYGSRQDMASFGSSATTNNNRLDKITVESLASGLPLKEYHLDQNYWNSSLNAQVGHVTNRKRMVLEGLEIRNGNGDALPDYVFEYYSGGLLPPRLSFDQDHWGYFNAAGNSSFIPFNIYDGDTDPCSPISIIADRESNALVAKYGMLKSVISPYGDKAVEYDYESHRVALAFPQQDCEEDCESRWANVSYYDPHSNTSGDDDAVESFTIAYEQEVEITVHVVQYGIGSSGASVSIWTDPGDADPTIDPELILLRGEVGGTDIPYDEQETIIMTLPPGDYELRSRVLASNEIANIRVDYKTRSCTTITEKIIGGVRIVSETSGGVETTYEFTDNNESSGVLVREPDYLSESIRGCHCSELLLNAGPNRIYANWNYSSTPNSSLVHSGGSHIYYSKVTEVFPGNGKTENIFQVYPDNPGIAGAYNYVETPFPNLDNSWINGLLRKTTVYNEAGKEQRIEENFYNYDFGHAGELWAMKISKDYLECIFGEVELKQFNVGFYPIRTQYAYLDSTSVKDIDDDNNELVQVTHYEYDDQYHQVRTTSEGSGGITYIMESTYVQNLYNDSFVDAFTNDIIILRDLHDKNMHIPVETRQYVQHPSQSPKLVGGSYTEFIHEGGFTRPYQIYKVETENSIAGFNGLSVSATGHLQKDGHYELQGTIVEYDGSGNVLEYRKRYHNPMSFIWDSEGNLPVAKITNAQSGQVFYTGFEAEGLGTDGNWEIIGSANSWVDGGIMDSHTGMGYFNLSNAHIAKATASQTGTYRLSFWHKGTQFQVLHANALHEQDGNSSEWTYFSTEIHLLPGETVTVRGTAISIDELRLHPVDALMETYSYDPATQQMVTSNTVNNLAAYYEYDDFHRLEYVRDQDKNIIQNYEYLYHDNPLANGWNQMRARTVLVPDLRDKTSFASDFLALDVSEKSETVQYMDGYGRASQEIGVNQSLVQGNDFQPVFRDVVSFHEYDDRGRETVQYLPFTVENNIEGALVAHPKSQQLAWYGSNPENTLVDKRIAETQKPYAEVTIEASPLARTLEQGAPGEDWQIGSGHTTRIHYRLNDGTEDVHNFQTGATMLSTNKYHSGNLFAITTLDENGNLTSNYKDKQGRIILVRKYLDEVINGSPVKRKVDTYNVYNDFGLLKAVISPKAVEAMKNSGNWNYEIAYKDLIYHYEYDHRLRLVAKGVPGMGTAGAERTKYYYDKRDQLVLTQDPNQQDITADHPQETGTFTKYDQLERPVQTGIYTVPNGVDINTEIESADMLYEIHTSSFSNGYTNRAFPSSDKIYHSHSFYDDYDFNNDGNPSVDYIPSHGVNLPQDYFKRLDGQLTASRVRFEEADGTVEWLTTATFYDERMRTVQVRSKHHLGYWDTNSTSYDFSGKVLTTKRKHQDGTGAYSSYVENFDYDGLGRLENVRYKARWDEEYIRSNHQYNELGQLIEKNLHYDSDANRYLQSIDYRYNVRGWLESINDTYAPSANRNVYSLVKGGQYMVDFSTDSEGKIKVSLGKSIDATLVGTSTNTTVTDGGQVLDTNQDMPSVPLSGFTIDLNSYDIDGFTDIDPATSALENEILDELSIQGVGNNKFIVDPITNTLKAMAKSTWYLVSDSYDSDDNDLYSQRLYYNEGNPNLGTTTGSAQYNGNVSSTVWEVAGSDTRQMYAFEYDDLDRLVKADYGTVDLTNGYVQGHRYSVPEISYDLNGNIKKLKRRGMFSTATAAPFSGLIDDLSYTYDPNSNRLLGVSDAKTIADGFVDGFTEIDPAAIIPDYEYDANGNMIVDRNKNLEIKYNHLNLPIHFGWNNDGNGNFDKEIHILYDAAGVKLRKTVIDNTPTGGPDVIRDYVGGIEYINVNGTTEMEAVYHADGRCVPRSTYANTYMLNGVETGIAFVYEYTLKDHLGNSRLSFADWDGDGQIEVTNDVATTEILDESHYYPFGMKMDMENMVQVDVVNNYKYNGKEMNADFDLNLIDYGARWYDPSIGRWHAVDPLAEKYVSHSPYNYVMNNPVINIDPDGRSVFHSNFMNENGGHWTDNTNGYESTSDMADAEDNKRKKRAENKKKWEKKIKEALDAKEKEDQDGLYITHSEKFASIISNTSGVNRTKKNFPALISSFFFWVNSNAEQNKLATNTDRTNTVIIKIDLVSPGSTIGETPTLKMNTTQHRRTLKKSLENYPTELKSALYEIIDNYKPQGAPRFYLDGLVDAYNEAKQNLDRLNIGYKLETKVNLIRTPCYQRMDNCTSDHVSKTPTKIYYEFKGKKPQA